MGPHPHTHSEFRDLFGIRRATYQPINAPKTKNERVPASPKANACYACCPDRKKGVQICNALLRNACNHAASLRKNNNDTSNWTLELNGAKFAIIPFPASPKDKYELIQKLINVNKRIRSNEFKTIITQRIPHRTRDIIIKQMLLHPDTLFIAPTFAADDPTPISHKIILRATPDIAIITDNTLDQLPGLTPNILNPNLREHTLTMPSIWSAIVQASTSTPDFYKQTTSEVDDQWNIPQHPNYEPKTPPHERKRPRITNINRKNQPGRGGTAGRHRIQHPHQEPSPCQEHQHNTAQEHNTDETKKKDSTPHQHHNDVWQEQKANESKYGLCRGSCSESQEDAHDDDMKQPRKLETTFDKEPNQTISRTSNQPPTRNKTSFKTTTSYQCQLPTQHFWKACQ
jgi:hypothetical protein